MASTVVCTLRCCCVAQDQGSTPSGCASDDSNDATLVAFEGSGEGHPLQGVGGHTSLSLLYEHCCKRCICVQCLNQYVVMRRYCNMFFCGLPCFQVGLAPDSTAVGNSVASVALRNCGTVAPSSHAAQPNSPTSEPAEPAKANDPTGLAEPDNSGLCCGLCCLAGHTAPSTLPGNVQLAETAGGGASAAQCAQAGAVTLDPGDPPGISLLNSAGVSDSLFRQLLDQKRGCDDGTSSQHGCGSRGAPRPDPPGPSSSDSDHESGDGSNPATLESPTDSEADFGHNSERDMVGMEYQLGMSCCVASCFELPPNPH